MVKYLKYTNPLVVYVLAIIGFMHTGIFCWLTLIYSFILVPLIELFIKPNATNLSAAQEEMAKQDKIYDYLLYAIVLLQIPTLFYFLYSFVGANLTALDIEGRITAMGMLCGTFGII